MKNLKKFLEHKAYNLRVSSIVSTSAAGSGHPTTCLSAADLVAALFFSEMRFDPRDHAHPNNDRFILSKGHAAPLLYAVWKELGVLNEDDLLSLRKFDSPLEGHPTLRFKQSEAATGSLGQGLSVGAGIALAAKMESLTYRTYVLLGDSEITEGSVWEAAEIASHYKLNNLIAILDVNRLGQSTATIDGHHLDKYKHKFEAFGWNTILVDGHNIEAIVEAYDQAHALSSTSKKPTIIIAKTVKGYGVDEVENKLGHHGQPFKKDEVHRVLNELKTRFADAASYDAQEWQPKLLDDLKKKITKRKIVLPEPDFGWDEKLATRKAYGHALKALGEVAPEVVVLDAEVKNSTFAEIFEKAFPQRFVQAFIAEQNMIGMAVGFANRGHIPFSSTFTAFLTRAFDQLRMAAIGQAPLRVSGSHAGVSIGQDGPSQMGLEDIAMMRTLPSSIVLYPCEAISTYRLVEQMANYHDGISYLRTTRSDTSALYSLEDTFPIGGCKVLRQSQNDRACIIAAGITVYEALKAYELLKRQNLLVSVIDLYSIKPLDQQTLKHMVARSGNRAVTVEDHYLAGGLGEAVTSALRNNDFAIDCLAVTKLPRSGKPEELLEFEEINAVAITKKVLG